ncbi:MAG: FHA domain-containing protein, partial [Actinomycetes bacterium]
NAGSRFLLDKEVVTAGRHPESDIFLDDITVSRRHAEIRRGPNGFTVHDVGSLNGTYLNRERVEDGELDAGDELQIRKFKLVFFAGSRPGGGGQGGCGIRSSATCRPGPAAVEQRPMGQAARPSSPPSPGR